jgi:choline kinase
VNGQPLLQLLVDALVVNGFKRLVVVVGHLENSIRSFLAQNSGGLTIEIIANPLYKTTNNIYSLWLANEKIQEASLLLECDLIFDHSQLEGLLYPDKIAISKLQPWMRGTLVSMNPLNRVSAFIMGNNPYDGAMSEILFKTVNIYSLSWPSWQKVFKRLDVYISKGRVHEYYETVFKEMVADGSFSLEGVLFGPQRWYEIDTVEDLKNAERILSQFEDLNEIS